MEARSEPQHRTKVNLCAGRSDWVSVRECATPNVQTRQDGSGGGGGGKTYLLTLGDLPVSALSGRKARNGQTKRREKSDHLIVALKPGNAGGAKGVTS